MEQKKRNKHISVLLSSELHTKLKQIAEVQGDSVNNLIVETLTNMTYKQKKTLDAFKEIEATKKAIRERLRQATSDQDSDNDAPANPKEQGQDLKEKPKTQAKKAKGNGSKTA